jgi:hypothetical protein
MNISNTEESSRRGAALRTGTSYETIRTSFNYSQPPLRYTISVILTVNKNRLKNIRRKSISSLTVLVYGISAIENGLFFVLLRLRSSEEAMNDVSLVDLRYL